MEIIDQGSNAVEGKHYRLLSNTITIKAGSRKADVQVRGLYDNIEDTDSLGFILKLVMPEQLKWDLYHDRTKVVMQKSCPYDINEFTGWCVVTSTFLNSYPGVENKSIQRLIRTEKHPTEENMIILHDWLFSGYDVTIRLDPGDPIEPLVTMDKNQVPTRLRSSDRSSGTTRYWLLTARSTTPISTAASTTWRCGSRCMSRTWA